MKTEKSIVKSYKKVPKFFTHQLKKRQLLIKEKMVIMANQLDLAAWYVMFVFI